jgi:hypothetical protein
MDETKGETKAAPPLGLPVCGQCAYAIRINEYGFHCHRFPPKAFGQVALDGSGGAYWDNLRPFVQSDDWCGEGRTP